MKKKEKLWQLDYACKVGDRVFWANLKGERWEGTLIEWNSNVAYVKLDDGTIKNIVCE